MTLTLPLSMPAWLEAELRSDHAGETGAIEIYRGILALTRDPGVREFAERHVRTEREHLDLINEVLPARARSRLVGLWRIAGWLTGALPAAFGPDAVYRTIAAVETFVDHHYAAQIDALAGRPEFAVLRQTLIRCQADEVHHRDEARGRAAGRGSIVVRLWAAIVGSGSAAAVVLARRI